MNKELIDSTNALIDTYKGLYESQSKMANELAGIVGTLMGTLDNIIKYPEYAQQNATIIFKQVESQLDNLLNRTPNENK